MKLKETVPLLSDAECSLAFDASDANMGAAKCAPLLWINMLRVVRNVVVSDNIQWVGVLFLSLCAGFEFWF